MTGAVQRLRQIALDQKNAGVGTRLDTTRADVQLARQQQALLVATNQLNLAPSYSQKAFEKSGRDGRWQVLASPDRRDRSLEIHQDAILSVAELGADGRLSVSLDEGRHGYLHVAFGSVRVGDTTLAGGDAITFSGPVSLDIVASDASQLLFFDLA